jgi:hypothetical protein
LGSIRCSVLEERIVNAEPEVRTMR